MVDYYDKILVGIAASLLAGGIAGVLLPIAIREGLAAGSLVATLFVYAGVFRNPPVSETRREVKYAAVAWHALLAVLLLAP